MSEKTIRLSARVCACLRLNTAKNQTPLAPEAHRSPALAPLPCSSLKAAISDVLRSALSGQDQTLWLDGRYIRWGLVEKRIHALVDAAMSATNIRSEP
jgi:hypothetical protein